MIFRFKLSKLLILSSTPIIDNYETIPQDLMRSNQNPRLKFTNPYRRASLTTATSLIVAPPNLRPKSNVNAKSKLLPKSFDPNPK